MFPIELRADDPLLAYLVIFMFVAALALCGALYEERCGEPCDSNPEHGEAAFRVTIGDGVPMPLCVECACNIARASDNFVMVAL